MQPHLALRGVDTLSAAVGRDTLHHGSGCKAVLSPDSVLDDYRRKAMPLDGDRCHAVKPRIVLNIVSLRDASLIS